MKKLVSAFVLCAFVAVGAPASGTESLPQFVQREAAASAAQLGANVRLEVSIGALPSGMQLAPCARIEPFVPSGVRLWGRTHVGMRCMQGANWSVLMPVTVKIFGPALVAVRPLAAQQAIAPDDVRLAEAEWTREPQGVATDPAQIDNRVLTRPLGVGQPVPLAALRAPLAVGQGDPVKVLGQGRGFTIQTDGIALAAAQEGQPVRVRTESGRILTGIARVGRSVEVQF
jgi:flagella basal body P-ring formation protein FlgA